jgi:hypothetical protein
MLIDKRRARRDASPIDGLFERISREFAPITLAFANVPLHKDIGLYPAR